MTDTQTAPSVLFLGTGPAMGIGGRPTSFYLLQAAGLMILVDCGPTVIQQLHAAGVAPHEIDAICFTHGHADHAAGYPMLMLWRLFKSPPGVGLPRIVASAATLAILDGVVGHSLGAEAAHIRAAPRASLPTDEASVTALGEGLTLRAWPMRHSPYAPVLGLRFEAGGKVVAFTGDTGACDNIVPLAASADLLVHEATFSAALNPEHAAGAFGHSTAQIAGRQAAAAGARRLALVHMDVAEAGQERLFIAEAAREYPGPISAPPAGALYDL